MSDPEAGPESPLLSALARLFDHQDELPSDPAARLRRIGWVFADKQYEYGESGPHSLADELNLECTGARGRVDWCPGSVFLKHHEGTTFMLRGWRIDQVRHVDICPSMRNAKLTYKYHSPVTGKEHRLDLSIREERHEFAHFTLKGQNYYWHFFDGHSAIVWHSGCLSDPFETLHMVAFRAAAVTCVRYDVPSATSLIHRLFTTSHESCVRIKRFEDDAVGYYRAPQFGHWSFYNEMYYNPARDAVLNHNEGAGATRNRLEKLAWDIRVISSDSPREQASMVTELPLLSARLSHQRRSRFVRIARTLLLARAQAREERIASDPVKKCAACAIQAAKSQLVLGLGRKRSHE